MEFFLKSLIDKPQNWFSEFVKFMVSKFIFKEINTFMQQRCITLIKSKFNVTKDFK